MTGRKPTLCVVAGPNGSGKTTTTIQLLNNEWAADLDCHREALRIVIVSDESRGDTQLSGVDGLHPGGGVPATVG